MNQRIDYQLARVARYDDPHGAGEDTMVDDGRQAGQPTGFGGEIDSRLPRRLRDFVRCVPARLGSFRLERLRAWGGMGCVFEARHEATGARAAVKVAPTSEPALAQALRAEVDALARIELANVPRVLDTGEAAGVIWMAMEFIAGTTLREVLRSSGGDVHFDLEAPDGEDAATLRVVDSAELGRRVGWLRDLAASLGQLHDLGILHRDIKPENIVIAADGVPYLIDFGLAIDPDEAPDDRFAGTLRYMSPEQTQGGRAGLRRPSDVYSLAVTFIEAVSGCAVVSPGAAQPEVLKQVAFDRVPMPHELDPRLPPSLTGVFRDAVHKRPEDRIDAETLSRCAGDWLAGQSAPRWQQLLRSKRARIVMVIMTGIVIAVAGFLWNRGRLRADRLARMDALLDARDFSGATRLAAMWVDEVGEDEELRARARAAILGAGPERTRALLRSTALSLATATTTVERNHWAEEAAKLLSVFEDPQLVFHVAFAALMRDDVAAARAVLERHRATIIPGTILGELDELLTSIGAGPRLAPRGAVPHAGAEIPDASMRLAFHAFRTLWRRPGVSVGERAAAVAALERDLAAALDETAATGHGLPPQQRLLLAFRALCRYELARLDEAAEDLRRLLFDPRDDLERAATLAALAATEVRRAHASQGAAREARLDEAVAALRAAKPISGPAVASASVWLIRAGADTWRDATLIAWADRVLGVLEEPLLETAWIGLVRIAISLAWQSGDFVRAVDLGTRAIGSASVEIEDSSALRGELERLARVGSWAAFFAASAARDGDDVAGVTHAVAGGRRLLELWRRLDRGEGLERSVVACLCAVEAAGARRARGTAPSPSEIQELEKRARRLLRRVRGEEPESGYDAYLEDAIQRLQAF